MIEYDKILIRGLRQNNLKNISLNIPENKADKFHYEKFFVNQFEKMEGRFRPSIFTSSH